MPKTLHLHQFSSIFHKIQPDMLVTFVRIVFVALLLPSEQDLSLFKQRFNCVLTSPCPGCFVSIALSSCFTAFLSTTTVMQHHNRNQRLHCCSFMWLFCFPYYSGFLCLLSEPSQPRAMPRGFGTCVGERASVPSMLIFMPASP